MRRIVVDASLANKLLYAAGPIELCDAAGRVLGQFTLASELEIPFSDEELARREAETMVYTTEEVLARLRAS